MMASTTSLPVTPLASVPSTLMSMFLAFLANKVCVAMTCSTSEVPMPWASAANAPWVEVWLSPHTTVMPGRVAPFSGPMTWMMPWRLDMNGKNAAEPNSAILLSSVVICSLLMGSVMPS